MRQPLHEAVLMNVLYTTTALAGEEKRFPKGGLATAYPTSIDIVVGSIGGFGRGGRIGVARGWRFGVYGRHGRRG